MTVLPIDSTEFRQNPYPVFTQIRGAGGVVRLTSPPVWAVSTFREAINVLSNPHDFSSSPAADFSPDLAGADPPVHTKNRRAVGAALSADTRSLEDVVESVASDLVSHFDSSDHFDLVGQFATLLPLRVMAWLLDIERERESEALSWVAAALGKVDAFGSEAKRVACLIEFEQYMGARLERYLSRPNGSFLSNLVNPRDSANTLPIHDALNIVRLLIIAGVETTTHLIGGTLLELLQDEESRLAIMSSPHLWPSFIEEAARFCSPVQFVNRQTTKTLVLGSASLPAGERVLVLIAGANRDPDQFSSPDKLLVGRTMRQHLGFGHGIHHCFGAALGRIEMRSALRAIQPLLGRLEIVESGAAIDFDGPVFRGPRKLMVRRRLA